MKKGNVIFIIVAIVLIATAALMMLLEDRGTTRSVVFIDALGNEIATIEYDGKERKITANDQGYYDYINIALEEAIAFYCEKNRSETNDVTSYFFENVSSVRTNFNDFYYKKIKEGFSSADLESDTPFASVIVDAKGRILAAYGYIGEGSKVYSLYKTHAGSAIKPLSVYAPAIENGTVHWSSPVKDAPIKKIKSKTEGIREWPANASGTYTNENMLVCDAIYKSTNTVAVRVLQRLDVKTSMEFLSGKLGMDLSSEEKILKTEDDDEIYGNIALGSLIGGVSPLEMAGYYQIFMNGGMYTEPYAVVSLTDVQGNILKKENENVRAISSATANIVTKLLEGVVKGGTGKAADIPGISIAGKTGTSDNYVDNWFVGFNGKFVCSVWHGYNDDNTNSAASIFGDILEAFPKTDSSFSVLKSVRPAFYCKNSGGIRGSKCRDAEMGYYIPEYMPEKCTECG